MAFQHASPIAHRQPLKSIAEDGDGSSHQPTNYRTQTQPRQGHEPQHRLASQRRAADSLALSDFGSFNTLAPSGTNGGQDNDTAEDNELDSLDDGLNAFREQTNIPHLSAIPQEQVTQTILPAHDGMGSFPVPNFMIQEQIWQFEKLNPRRHHNSSEPHQSGIFRSLDEVVREDQSPKTQEDAKTQRIEQWRLEQSRILLDELQKKAVHHQLDSQYRNVLDNIPIAPEVGTPSKPGFWRKMTQKVIRDLIGLDDQALSLLFGETFVEDEDLSKTPTPRWTDTVKARNRATDAQTSNVSEESWTERILSLLASELDSILHQINEARSNTTTSRPIDYAGIPASDHHSIHTQLTSHTHMDRTKSDARPHPSSADDFTSQLDCGVEKVQEHQDIDSNSLSTREDLHSNELDLPTIISYLASRLFQENHTAELGPSANGHRKPAGRADAAAARAAVIERYHPLVSRYRHTQRIKHVGGSAGVAKANRYHNLNQTHIKRRSESCASQSTRHSRHQFSDHSRNFWDIGGSIGGESVFDVTGAWGEV